MIQSPKAITLSKKNTIFVDDDQSPSKKSASYVFDKKNKMQSRQNLDSISNFDKPMPSMKKLGSVNFGRDLLAGNFNEKLASRQNIPNIRDELDFNDNISGLAMGQLCLNENEDLSPDTKEAFNNVVLSSKKDATGRDKDTKQYQKVVIPDSARVQLTENQVLITENDIPLGKESFPFQQENA